MANSIQISGATFANTLTSLTLPDRSALLGEYVFGGTQAASIKNRANPSKPLTVVGSPTYTSNSVVTTNGANGFLTGISGGADITLLAIRKLPSSVNFTVAVGNDTNTNQIYGLTQYQGITYLYDSVGVTAGISNGAKISAPASGTSYFMQAAVTKSGSLSRLYQYASGVQSFNDAALSFTRVPAEIRIGGGSGSNAGTTCEIAYVAIFDRALTSSEIQSAYASLAAYYASLGVTLW